MDPGRRTVPTTRSSSTYRTCSGHHDVTLVGRFGASRGEVAINVGAEEVQRSVGAARIDVEIFEVIAHDAKQVRVGKCALLCQPSVSTVVHLERKHGGHTYRG